ncbi:MAG: glycosyltransferase family 4 protein [Geminicoccaceae bacterium]|nr:glycosyltransferase family 4 protein [Geminicoccaceae bacterium]MDW8370400.1 glycosyltransferase family 4 protein [Geminicoccaceae bacterium]
MIEPRLVLAVPCEPDLRTGGTIYDRRLAEGLRARGWRVDWLRLPDGFPFPDEAAVATSERAFSALPEGTLLLVDGLALGVLPELAERASRRLRLLALVHHPLGFEEGLDPARAARLIESERAALRWPRRILCTSRTTARTLAAEFAVAPERIVVIEPGTDPAPQARGSGGPEVRLLAVGSVIPRKRLDRLVRALARLQHLPWRLEVVGALDRSAEALSALHRAIAETGLGDRVVLAGELVGEALEAAFDRADLFVSASGYEGYGMALAEALARGLPIVAVAGGAVADWLPAEAALSVPPEEEDALPDALARAIGDPALRARLREGAIAARAKLPRWEEQVRRAEAVLRAELEA